MYSKIRQEARDALKGKHAEVFIYQIVFAMLTIGISALSVVLIVTAPIALAFLLVCPAMTFMFMCRFIDRGEIEISFKHFFKFLGVYLCIFLMIVAMLIPGILLIFLFSLIGSLVEVPELIIVGTIVGGLINIAAYVGIVILSFALSFVPFIMRDTNFSLGVGDTIRLSVRMTTKRKRELFVLPLTYLGHFIMCILSLGTYFVIILPEFTASLYIYYKVVRDEYLTTHTEDAVAQKLYNNEKNYQMIHNLNNGVVDMMYPAPLKEEEKVVKEETIEPLRPIAPPVEIIPIIDAAPINIDISEMRDIPSEITTEAVDDMNEIVDDNNKE